MDRQDWVGPVYAVEVSGSYMNSWKSWMFQEIRQNLMCIGCYYEFFSKTDLIANILFSSDKKGRELPVKGKKENRANGALLIITLIWNLPQTHLDSVIAFPIINASTYLLTANKDYISLSEKSTPFGPVCPRTSSTSLCEKQTRHLWFLKFCNGFVDRY